MNDYKKIAMLYTRHKKYRFSFSFVYAILVGDKEVSSSWMTQILALAVILDIKIYSNIHL